MIMGKLIKNKYYRWYYQIIDSARKRSRPDGYYEKHHIIPRCMGGNNEWWNIVNLTYREHYLAHWLLTKITEGEILKKMNYALVRMGQCNPRQIREISSRWYERSKQAARDANIGRKPSEETRKRISLAGKGHKRNLGRKPTEEHKMKIGLKSKGRKHTDEAKKKMSIASKGNKRWLGKNHTTETKKKLSGYKNALGAKRSEETKLAISLAGIGNKRGLGYKHTDEAKFRIKIASIGRKHTEETKQKMGATKVGNKYMLGKKHTEEAKRKIGAANAISNLGKKHTVEHIQKMRASLTGRKLSEETKQKIKETKLRRLNESVPTFGGL